MKRVNIAGAVMLTAILLAPGTAQGAQGSLQITKTADASSVDAGSQIGYTIAVSTSSRGRAAILVSDTLPTNPGTSWSISPANPSCSISSGVLRCATQLNGSFSVHIVSPTTNSTCGQVSNSASVSSVNLGSATSPTASITVECQPLSVHKLADSSTVNAGEQAGYFIFAQNNGTKNATGFTLTDTLPAGLVWDMAPNPDCTLSSSAGTQTLTCGPETVPPQGVLQAHVVATTSASNCPSISNTASVTATNGIPASSGPVTITVRCRPDLVVQSIAFTPSTTDGPDAYTVTVKNQGPGSADLAGVVLSGSYSNGGGGSAPACDTTIPSGTLAPGATTNVTVPCSTSAPAGYMTLLVTVDASNVVEETDEANNVGSVSLFSVALSDDGACTFTAVATWHNTQPDQVLGSWYLDGAFLFVQEAPGTGTINGNTATFTVGPFNDTSPATHTWQVQATFLTGPVNDGDAWSNVLTRTCGLF